MTARLLIGRSEAADLRLRDGAVSGEHAVINWNGNNWRVRDLGSRNGTLLNGRRLSAGVSVTLNQGDAICFGRADNAWTLEEVAPPGAYARRDGDGFVQHTAHGMLCLPNTDAPLVTIFEDQDGVWVAERDGVVSPTDHRASIELDNDVWVVFLPHKLGATTTLHTSIGPPEEVSLRFRVSRDEELVDVDLIQQGKRQRLEPRAHHYLLLTLARQRVAEESLAEEERGWLYREDLEKMLKFDATHLNVQVYRARKQLHKAGLAAAVHIIERRNGRLRLGVRDFTIETM